MLVDIDILHKIQSKVKDIVFVGGVSEMLQHYKNSTKDIDVVVDDESKLKCFGEIKYFTTDSIVSVGYKRAYIDYNGIIIDIFIGNLPKHIIVKGVKCETIDSIKNRYLQIYLKSNGYIKDIFYKKIKNIENRFII